MAPEEADESWRRFGSHDPEVRHTNGDQGRGQQVLQLHEKGNQEAWRRGKEGEEEKQERLNYN